MTDALAIAKEMLDGLADVTAGPWKTWEAGYPHEYAYAIGGRPDNEGAFPVVADVCIRKESAANATHIAKCSPDRIRTLAEAYIAAVGEKHEYFLQWQNLRLAGSPDYRAQAEAAEAKLTAAEARIAELEGDVAVASELWALCYLNDWGPMKEGQAHRWESGKNVFPEVHAFYRDWRWAEAIRRDMCQPDRYWVVKARPESEARLDKVAGTRPDPALSNEVERLRESLKPFADHANAFDEPGISDDMWVSHRLGDFRRAARALQSKEPSDV